jgi:uncharacterized protein involved in tellurium resistance
MSTVNVRAPDAYATTYTNTFRNFYFQNINYTIENVQHVQNSQFFVFAIFHLRHELFNIVLGGLSRVVCGEFSVQEQLERGENADVVLVGDDRVGTAVDGGEVTIEGVALQLRRRLVVIRLDFFTLLAP